MMILSNQPVRQCIRLRNPQAEVSFENTFHVHCPRVFYNNASRNVSEIEKGADQVDRLQVFLFVSGPKAGGVYYITCVSTSMVADQG